MDATMKGGFVMTAIHSAASESALSFADRF
jgi:hypothetical protein